MQRILSALVGAALLCAPASAAVPSDKFLVRNAGDLVEICTVVESDELYPEAIAFCHGYLVGAYHYHNALYSRRKAKPIFCLPDPPPSRTKAVEQYVAWVKENPKYTSEPAVETIFKFLAEKYPCPK